MTTAERKKFVQSNFTECGCECAPFPVYYLDLKEYKYRPLGYHVKVFHDQYNFQGWHNVEWFDFLEDKNYKDVVNELCKKYGTAARIWVVFTEIETP